MAETDNSNKPLNPRSHRAKKQQPKVDLAKRGMIQAVSTAEGIALFKEIMDACHYQRPTSVADPNNGEVFELSSAQLEGRRTLWLRLRKLIPRDKLILIEIPEPQQETQEEET